ncbi:MAG: hypothetical protein QW531_04890 [Thermoplasmata archaeon]
MVKKGGVEMEDVLKREDVIEKFGGIDLSFYLSEEVDFRTIYEDIEGYYDDELIGCFKGKPKSYTIFVKYGCGCKVIANFRKTGKDRHKTTVYFGPCKKHIADMFLFKIWGWKGGHGNSE